MGRDARHDEFILAANKELKRLDTILREVAAQRAAAPSPNVPAGATGADPMCGGVDAWSKYQGACGSTGVEEVYIGFPVKQPDMAMTHGPFPLLNNKVARTSKYSCCGKKPQVWVQHGVRIV